MYLYLKKKEPKIVGNNSNAEKWFDITKNSVFRNDSLADIEHFLSVMCENLLRLQLIHGEANGINLTVNAPETKLSSLYDVEGWNKETAKNEGYYKRARDDLTGTFQKKED